ncbi:MAG: hypothetical protein EBY38_10565 [Flavobacteriaceae bacterium]|nr:hypothetical protein [Flavobacteriaceae bacterium]
MSLFGNSVLAGSAGQGPSADLGDTIEQSLRFNGGNNGSNAFLVNTSITCPTTFTYSAWVKLGFDMNAAESAFIFFSQSNLSSGSNPGPVFRSWCQGATNANTGRIEWWTDTGTGIKYYDGRFRDPSAWYHVVLSSDGSNVTLYVNGQNTYGSYAANVTMTQPIYRPAVWATYKQGGRQLLLATAQYEAAEQELLVRVTQTYFDLLSSQDSLEFVKAQKKGHKAVDVLRVIAPF